MSKSRCSLPVDTNVLLLCCVIWVKISHQLPILVQNISFCTYRPSMLSCIVSSDRKTSVLLLLVATGKVFVLSYYLCLEHDVGKQNRYFIPLKAASSSNNLCACRFRFGIKIMSGLYCLIRFKS